MADQAVGLVFVGEGEARGNERGRERLEGERGPGVW